MSHDSDIIQQLKRPTDATSKQSTTNPGCLSTSASRKLGNYMIGLGELNGLNRLLLGVTICCRSLAKMTKASGKKSHGLKLNLSTNHIFCSLGWVGGDALGAFLAYSFEFEKAAEPSSSQVPAH